ncbi:hypothetical protein [Streptomyces sp. NPDC086182]|jgi:hypothetical protein|uniref:hypothetical protein n=1 Tax=Streptomyces sp. NPDC086182 TaxID=3155058 RepID=UPI003430D871
MEALGRTVNVISVADGVYIGLRDCGGVAFSCYLAGAAGDTYTLVEAKDAAGTGAQNLAAVTRYYTCTGDGTDAWTKRTQAAAATVVTAAAATQNAMWVEIDGAQLSDDYDYVKLTSTGAGRVEAIARDLVVQRAPANLPALGA